MEIIKRNTKKKLVIKEKWYAILKNFEPDIRLEVYEAVFDYILSGATRQLSPVAMMAFAFIKAEIDSKALRKRRVSLTKVDKSSEKVSDERANDCNKLEPQADVSCSGDQLLAAPTTLAGLPDPSQQPVRRYPRKLKKRLKKSGFYIIPRRSVSLSRKSICHRC